MVARDYPPPTAWQRFVKGYWTFIMALGTVVSVIMLTLIYFSVLAATSIVMRLLGSDLLHMRRHDSYWKHRDKQPDPTIERYKRQF